MRVCSWNVSQMQSAQNLQELLEQMRQIFSELQSYAIFSELRARVARLPICRLNAQLARSRTTVQARFQEHDIAEVNLFFHSSSQSLSPKDRL